MKFPKLFPWLCGCVLLISLVAQAADAAAPAIASPDRPDPAEIPLPVIKTSMTPLPGVGALPVRKEMPDVLTMNDGTKVTTPAQWAQRREEMRHILEYYSVGLAPPPPGNVKGNEMQSQLVANGTVRYRLIHLTFGPEEKLSLDIGVFTPVTDKPVPAVISIEMGASPPGAAALPKLPQGATQGKSQDVLLIVGNGTATPAASAAGGGFGGGGNAESIAARGAAKDYLDHGFAYVTFNYNDCGEDTTLRNADGSWAFRNTRFFPAYPNYDWGLLRAWAWGASRVVDYLVTDPAIDKDKLIVTGVSRTGKAALVAGAFDDRISMIAPGASSGGGTPAYRFSGAGRGGKEGLDEMVKKYPNWFSANLHQFWGQQDKLPFDEHWFIALCAPRPFIALEGNQDQNVVVNGVRQSYLAALPAYKFLGVPDKVGVSWANRMHGSVQGDWDALIAFADKNLLGMNIGAWAFDKFPDDAATPPTTATTPAAPTSSN
ncbi:MAG TPA: alpha/beta hydrolase family protein [Opitutales bacterium]|nr:alpha/beta hydrolase family protein [Opitutales bacterium]